MSTSQISIRDFVGNDIEVSELTKWLNEKFHGGSKKNYAILCGEHGNGKTFLVKGLANSFNVPLYLVDFYNYSDKESLNDLKKTLDVECFGYNHSKKIILVDDIYEFNSYSRKELMNKIPKFTDNPVIFTTSKKHYKIPSNFKKNSVFCRLKKPRNAEMVVILSRKAKELGVKLSDSDLLEIARRSPSVRSAIISLYTSTVNDIEVSDYSIYAKLQQIKNKRLKVNISKYLVKLFAQSAYDYKTMNFLASMNVKTNVEFVKEIDKFMFNHYPYLKMPDYHDLKFSFNNKDKEIDDQKKICEELHISSNVLKNEYKFISNEKKDKKKEVNLKSQKKNKDTGTVSLTDFY